VTIAQLARRPPYLRIVPLPEPPRLKVRINVDDRRQPFGRSRIFRLGRCDFEELIAVALRLEAQR